MSSSAFLHPGVLICTSVCAYRFNFYEVGTFPCRASHCSVGNEVPSLECFYDPVTVSSSGAGTISQQGGQAWCVTQPFQAGVWGHCKPPPHAAGSGAEPRRQTHLCNNRLEIN